MSVERKLTLYVNGEPVSSKLILGESTQKRPVSKETLDTINSICWLAMDAFWMFSLAKIGLIFGIPAIITGLWMMKKERKFNWISLATNCWIWMNIMWMFSDTYSDYEQPFLTAAKSFLMLGMTCVSIAAVKSGGVLKTFSHYKSYKHFQLFKNRK